MLPSVCCLGVLKGMSLCECHAAIVSSGEVESYSKHRPMSSLFAHDKLNNAESCHSGRGNDYDSASKTS